jgi:hypothetical protein
MTQIERKRLGLNWETKRSAYENWHGEQTWNSQAYNRKPFRERAEHFTRSLK